MAFSQFAQKEVQNPKKKCTSSNNSSYDMMDFLMFELAPAKLLYAIYLLWKDGLITNEERLKAKELVVAGDSELYDCLEDLMTASINVNAFNKRLLETIQGGSVCSPKTKKSSDSESCPQEGNTMPDSNQQIQSQFSNTNLSRPGWVKPSFQIGKQRMGAKITKVFSDKQSTETVPLLNND